MAMTALGRAAAHRLVLGAALALAPGPPAVASAAPAAHCSLAGPDGEVAWPSEARRPDAAAAAPLRRVADVPLPGGASRFDYQSIDPERRRLYIAHMGAGELLVFDLRAGRVEARVRDLPRVTGVLAVPAERRVYASAAGAHRLTAIDAATLGVVAKVGGIRFPDGIAYAPEERRLFVSDEAGRQDVAVDAETSRVAARVGLGGEAGNTRFDPVSHCILVAVQTAGDVVAIDPARLAIVRRVHLRGIESPHGLLVDSTRRLLFVAGAANATLGVLDADTLAPLAKAPLGDDPDVLALDPGDGWLYVGSESGVVSVFALHGRSVLARGTLRAPHAHSVAVDPATHRVYLPLANVGGRPVLRILEPGAGW